MNKNEAKLDLSVDKNRLDDEWEGQPLLCFRYMAMLADARRDLDEAKSDFDLIKAELYREISKDPETFGLAKTTEKAIESAIPTDQRHHDAQAAVIEARHAMDIVQAAVTAIEHRRKTLEYEVQLFLADYYSRVRTPEGAKDKVREIERKAVRRGRKRD